MRTFRLALVGVLVAGGSVLLASAAHATVFACQGGPQQLVLNAAGPSCFTDAVIGPSGALAVRAHVDGIGIVSARVTIAITGGETLTASCGPTLNTCDAVVGETSSAGASGVVTCSTSALIALSESVACEVDL